MTYEKIVAAVKKAVAKKDVSKVADMALSIYISGEGEGEFYIAVKNGKLEIEKYKYEDYTAHISTTAEALLDAVKGQGKALKVDDGNAKQISELTKIIFPKKTPAKKATVKTAAEKKAPAKKSASKPAAEKKVPAKKTAAKPAAEKKIPAKKAEAKPVAEKKAPAKKAATKLAAEKKTPAKKATTKPAAEKKTPAKKTASAKKTVSVKTDVPIKKVGDKKKK